MNEAKSIERFPIDSSGIKSVGYVPDRHVLAIEFPSGSIYHYRGVPSEVFEAFASSASRGRFYAQHIKGHFVGEAMTGLCPTCGAQGLIGEPCDDCGCATVRAVDRTHKP